MSSYVHEVRTIYHVLIGIVVVVTTVTLSDVTARCPPTCFCQRSSRAVFCSRRGLDAIPDTLPRDTRQLHLNGNHFKSPVIRRSNFSRFPGVFKSEKALSMASVERVSGLEHLYMSDCAISKIDAGAFVDLVYLRWLDLSDNRLTSLSDGTFAGLHLYQLFLNGNQRLALDDGSPFANLTVFGLYLHDCRLMRLDVRTIVPLNGSLHILWLSENRLDSLDPALSGLFATLDHFRLTDNRLHCNCELSWLWRLYGEQRRRTNKGLTREEVAECTTPEWLRGRHFSELSEDDFRCRAPTLDVEVTLIDDDDNKDDEVGQSSRRRRLVLRCTATGDPTPDVYWARPSSSARRPLQPMTQKNAVDDVGEALLILDDYDIQSTSHKNGVFRCVASNVVGNVTLTVRRILQTWEVASDPDTDPIGPRYTYIDGDVSETRGMDKRRLFIQENRLTARSEGESRYICNRTDSSQLSYELCAGRDRRLRASSPLDGLGVQSSTGSDSMQQYGVDHLVVAVVLTVLLTATSVVAAAAACLHHHHERSASGAELQHHRSITDNNSTRRTVSSTSAFDTVAHLTTNHCCNRTSL